MGSRPDNEFSQAELKAVANADQDSEGMHKLQEGFDALTTVCRNVRKMYTESTQNL